jgi:hypothetical protein
VAIAPVPSRDEIIRQYACGELGLEIARLHKRHGDQEDPFLTLCVDLHNAGEIDLVKLPSEPAFAELSGHRFFVTQRFYSDAIPLLHASAKALMECCGILIDQAGADGAANRPIVAFAVWCENNREKAAEVILGAREGDELARRFAGAALQGLGNADQAISFIQSFADDRRRSGIRALGRIAFADAAGSRKAIAVLQPLIADGPDDSLRAGALLAAFDLLQKHKDGALAGAVLGAACEQPGPETLYALAQILWMKEAMLDIGQVRRILGALKAVKPEHLGTIQSIDTALPELLKKDDDEFVLDFLTAVLEAGAVTMENFEVTADEIATNDPQRLYELCVRWLLSGKRALCGAVVELVGSHPKRPFDESAASLNLTPDQQSSLCRKAIGYLFAYPVACCSIIVSVLRACEESVSSQLADLLFDPILVSYAGEPKDYLASIPAMDTAYPAVRKALAQIEQFQADLQGIGVIKELQPSEYQRDVVRQRQFDEMRAIQKQAESQSVFLSTGAVHRTNILYGRRALTYVAGYDGSQSAVEMDLKTITTSWELPHRDILDPTGLMYMLRVFQVE